ncbi:GAF domain-containing sensor histidine kinase [Alteromonas sp. ASW11-36]|uniref:histidine kinase n=1 Tax=Alteromonas arenosi TaxID=3055817 RepID=A0ABT7STL5_9ALTE|nr:GAF domain-containing sensor histidine kinase [Alteromonas sp. ASW11-36]MDM7859506.1 GAF domain-containing sensor histidine kinase [Alteromonas sp. ASW11-36]
MRLKLIDNADTDRLAQIKSRSVIEQGRANALDQLICGASLKEVMEILVKRLEAIHPSARFSIMLVDPGNMTLSPLVAPSLSETFINALQHFPISATSGCCGAAVFTRQPVYVDNVFEHPNWQSFVSHARDANIVACWSQPLIGPDNQVYGSLAAFADESSAPTEEDSELLCYEAELLSLIIARSRNIEALKLSREELEHRVEERTKEFTEANLMLSKALDQRNEVRSQLLEMENMAALGTMMSSLTHEINTPIGVAITAATYLKAMQVKSKELFDSRNLKRSDLASFYQECGEASEIIERNLTRTSHLIRTFKQLSTDQHSQEPRPINLCGYIDEVLLSLKPRLKRFGHIFCIDVNTDLEIQSNPGAISQILINLIMNSAQHAFEPHERGHITIKAKIEVDRHLNEQLVMVYRDNGKGMTDHTVANIYKPFFTSARATGGTGLGMHICYNLAVDVLRGSIDCESKLGKGTTFTLRIPLN